MKLQCFDTVGCVTERASLQIGPFKTCATYPKGSLPKQVDKETEGTG